MPELPEVETTRSYLAPHLEQQQITKIVVRQPKLRWMVPADINQLACNSTILSVKRRAKYILINMAHGSLISHLGMSGSWQLLTKAQPIAKHDHLDIELSSGNLLRYTDPRRFGCLLWATKPLQHKLLAKLGVEPLADEFNANYLFERAKGRKTAVKLFIMDAAVVVGVGNIYANEALFAAKIAPNRAVGQIKLAEFVKLVAQIKAILRQAIVNGGTTLKDFSGADGKPGYFQQKLLVYGKAGQQCAICSSILIGIRQGQRATTYCPKCQI